MKIVFSRADFRKNPKISNLLKIRSVGAELFHANGQTDGNDEAKNRFSRSCERT
jgi:hypothetical protein